jgi:DNA primase
MSVIEEIKARLDIVQFISQSVPLRRAGRNWTAPCPFHNEKTPSFIVSPDRQNWRCFGACGDGGDVISFFMKKENLDFKSALSILAERTGIQLQERTPEQQNEEQHQERLRGLVAVAADFFHKQLLSAPVAAEARAYAKKRGLSDAIISQFKLGYAANSRDSLSDHLRLLGYETDTIIEAGLAGKNEESNRLYDRFRNRLMIPICDERGRAVGFGARALDPDDQPKYLNSPQTPLFNKSAILFAMHHARPAVREQELAVIVEGYMDAIQAHQSGFANVVAQMGTALTQPQLRILRKYTQRVVLALDPDSAGVRATLRGLDVVRQASEETQMFFDAKMVLRQAGRLDLEMRIATMPNGQDPDEVLRNSPAQWATLIANAQPVADYVIAQASAALPANASLAERERAARELLPILVASENNLQQQANLQQLAYKLRLGSGRSVVEWAQQYLATPAAKPDTVKAPPTPALNQQPANTAQDKPLPPPATAAPAIEAYCLGLLVTTPELLAKINRLLRQLRSDAEKVEKDKPAVMSLATLQVEDFTNTEYQVIFKTLEDGTAQPDEDPGIFLEKNLAAAFQPTLKKLVESPWEQYTSTLSDSFQAMAMGAVNDQHGRISLSETGEPDNFAKQSLLELRRSRLRRNNDEILLLQQELQEGQAALSAEEYSTREQMYGKQLRANQIAQRIIVKKIHNLRLKA